MLNCVGKLQKISMGVIIFGKRKREVYEKNEFLCLPLLWQFNDIYDRYRDILLWEKATGNETTKSNRKGKTIGRNH